MAKYGRDEVDLPSSRVIAALTPAARRRMESVFLRRDASNRVFRAEEGEIALEGITFFTAKRQERKIATQIHLKGNVGYGSDMLTVNQKLPDTLVAGLRGRRMTDLVGHSIFEDLVISSGREVDGVPTFHQKAAPGVELSHIQSIGAFRLETLEGFRDWLLSNGVREIDRLFLRALSRLDEDGLTTMRMRLEKGRATMHDLLAYMPYGMDRMSADIKDGRVRLHASFKMVGHYSDGHLVLHTNNPGRYLNGSLFGGFSKDKHGHGYKGFQSTYMPTGMMLPEKKLAA